MAVTVTVDADRGVANQITPGDHVDIAVPQAAADGSADVTYSYMLSDVKVLAVGATTTQTAAAPATAGDASSTDAAAAPHRRTRACSPSRCSKDDALRIISANSGSSKIYLVLLPPSTVTSAK